MTTRQDDDKNVPYTNSIWNPRETLLGVGNQALKPPGSGGRGKRRHTGSGTPTPGENRKGKNRLCVWFPSERDGGPGAAPGCRPRVPALASATAARLCCDKLQQFNGFYCAAVVSGLSHAPLPGLRGPARAAMREDLIYLKALINF